MKHALIFFAVLLSFSAMISPAFSDALDNDRSKDKVAPVVPLKVHAFPLEDVRLLDGPFKHAMELDRQYLLSLDVDRLLHTFRVNAGLPSSAKPLGGWEEPNGELRGHFVGHYLTACALMYAATGDEKLKHKGDAVVAGLAECQAKIGSGYLSAYPEEFFDRVETSRRVWAPYYTLHKIYAGLLDMYIYCDNQQALDACKKFADWVIVRNDKLTDEQMQKMLGVEHGGMNEALANLYAVTGEEKYLNIAKRFNHKAVLDPAAKQEDKLTGLHANTQFPKFIGIARQYELTGEDWMKTAATFFWNMVVNERSYVIGGNSDGEGFSPKETLSKALGPNTTETCNTYNMLKLTRHLFCLDPQAQYADYYERALYNHILASQNPEDGMMCYYVPLRSGSRKNYGGPLDAFWCCTGTGVENHAKYGDSIYFHDEGDLYVNLFIASELNWKEKGIKLRQETKYPDEPSTTLAFICKQPVEMGLHIRHPWWATKDFEILVNGEKQDAASTPGSYKVIKRAWKTGDLVKISMPFSLRTEGFRDNPRRFAFMNGPLVLCAQVDPKKPFPAVVAEEGNVLEGLKPVEGKPSTFTGSAEEFRIAGDKQGGGATLEPFYKMHGGRRYEVYWDLLSPSQWQAKEKEYQAESERQKEIETRVIDIVRPNEEQNERDHNVKGENTSSGEYNGGQWRHATDGGWFSWEVKVLPDQDQELLVTYFGSDANNRIFDITIDDAKLATQRLENNRPGQFYEEIYKIPAEMVKGKNKVTVKFQAHPGATAGGSYGLRVMKSAAAKKDDTQDKSTRAPGDYTIKPVPFTTVHLSDVFWAPRIEINRTVTIPFAFEQCEKSGRMDNFDRAAAALRGEELKNKKAPGFPFDDTDPYKVLEGASYALAVKPDPKLEAYLDGLIAKIAAAQEPDGYLYTTRTIDPEHPHQWAGKKRWEKDPDLSHELYNAGHLFEAAAAHFQATGKRNLLDIAVKEANLLCDTFGPDKLHICPGHQIVEMGLVKLYRVTGDERYLNLAKFFLDARGPGGKDYSQAHLKPVDQTKAVGHAVRAGYMYSGMADVAAMTGDQRYVMAIDAIWENVVGKKLYITGGIGARGSGEAFGRDYELPNLSAYCETCAAIANVYWNQRLFLLHGDAKYIDVMERTLYNGLLSGVSLDGKGFFYPNPLESDGSHQRSPWFGCACCPGNMTRFLASVPGYVYAGNGDDLYVNLYAGGAAEVKMDGGRTVKMTQETRYPWDGAVKITVEPDKAGEFTVNLRIPGWARGEAVPSDLYRFQDNPQEPVMLKINGENVPVELNKGYASLKRPWKSGDVIELNLPMPVHRILANDKVADDAGKVALERGPLVYCVEWPDVKDGKVINLMLPDEAPILAEFRADLLGGVEVLRGEAMSLRRTDIKNVDKEKVEFTAIPYYAWANRGRGEMAVWLARTQSAARPLPAGTIASMSKATASGGDVRALNDQREPKNSGDQSNRFLHWWPSKGTKQWVQYDFAKPARVSAVEVFWFDDTGVGECRLPKSWQLLYRDAGAWKPVENPSGYGCDGDRYNRTTFDAVETDGLRLEVQLPDGFSSGIHEWRVE